MQKELRKFAVQLHHEKLDNGADLFLFERKGMPISLRATFFAGSRFDDIPGTAHFLEHMLLAGTKKFPTKNLISDHIQKVGGDFGASTGNNSLRFNIEIPEAQDLNIGIEVMSECLTNSLFDDKTIETERGAILTELKGKKANPKEYIWEVQRRLALQGTSAGRSTLGDETSIKSITKEVLLDYAKRFINSGRVAFVASGDVSITELREKLNSVSFEVGERFAVEGRLPVIRDKTVDVEFYKDMEHLQVSFICRTNVRDYKEYCALMVLNSILGVGRGSRLMTRLRYENGLVYSVSTQVFDTVDWGTLKINFSCDKNNFEKVRELIFKEFNNLKENNVSSVELQNVKSKITKGSIRAFQTSDSWVGFHEDDALFSPDELHTPLDYMQAINSLNLDDIRIVIDKYLSEKNFCMAICGDYRP